MRTFFIIVICLCSLIVSAQDSLVVQQPNVAYYDDPDTFFNRYPKHEGFKEIIIFNRWGEQVFQSEDPEFIWNGRTQDTEELLPKGMYIFLLKTKTDSFTMYVTLIGHYCSG